MNPAYRPMLATLTDNAISTLPLLRLGQAGYVRFRAKRTSNAKRRETGKE
jgi:hypothetical protein